MSRETVIVQVMPVWAREDVLAALSVLPSNVILRLYNEGVIRARKMNATKERISAHGGRVKKERNHGNEKSKKVEG